MSLLKDKIEIKVEEAELAAQKTFKGFSPLVKKLVIILAIAIIPCYYISKIMSEKFWLLKYKKTAVTAKRSFANPLPPKTSNVTVVNQYQGVYAAAVKLENQNLELSLHDTPYTFTFYNAQKQKIYSYEDRLFLLPNQSKYIIAPRFSSVEKIEYADFQLTLDAKWQKRLSIPKVTLTISKANTGQELVPSAFSAEGSFINNSPYTLKQARLSFVLFDKGGKIIGLSQRDEFTIRAFERRAYKQLWPNLLASLVSRVEVFAETNPLDPDNLTNGNELDEGANLDRPK